MRIQRTIRLRPEVDEALRRLSAEEDISVSRLIDRACTQVYLAPKDKRGRKQ